MPKYKITSNYEYEKVIEANNEIEAVEQWHATIEKELAKNNQILENEFGESIIATKLI